MVEHARPKERSGWYCELRLRDADDEKEEGYDLRLRWVVGGG